MHKRVKIINKYYTNLEYDKNNTKTVSININNIHIYFIIKKGKL